ncbi:MAG: bifunctional helix-turn-helix transcriptional regulator/GNAT family N-acetyltransferase [Gemmatimonadaceae bacterium]
MTQLPPADPIAAVRRFNRFYTQLIRALDEGHLHTPFSLAEARVLYEIAHRDPPAPTAAEIAQGLGLDAGYLSRILRGFEKQGLIERATSATDARQSHVRLTAAGDATFAELDNLARADVASLLSMVSGRAADRLLDAMRTIERLLGGERRREDEPPPYLLRQHRPGDMGWVVSSHGRLYADEYGWDERFEALVAEIVAAFLRTFDPKRERCWIAERDGENVGSVFLVSHPEREHVAKLRLLLVEPGARGLGIGRRLVDECVRFARQAQYDRITLWTNSVLSAARLIYERAGFELTNEEAHESFGARLTGQTWELSL